MSLYELLHNTVNNLWCTNYFNVRNNTVFAVVHGVNHIHRFVQMGPSPSHIGKIQVAQSTALISVKTVLVDVSKWRSIKCFRCLRVTYVRLLPMHQMHSSIEQTETF